MTKNKIKKLSIVALTGLVAVSAYAFIKDSQVQSGINLIRPGQISIQFTNESDSVALSGNTAIPMSDSYAKTNLVSYKFDIVNDGDVDLDYSVYAYEINSTFNTAKIDVMLKDGEGEMLYVDTLEKINRDAEDKTALVSKVNMAPNDTHSYELIAHIDGSLPLYDYTGKEASFKLIVDAKQHTDGEPGSGSSIDLTNINSNGVVGDFSTKGNLVSINDTQYRVLSIEGTQAKVLSMGDGQVSFYGGLYINNYNYADSELDKNMTKYYDSLPNSIQNAIVSQNISQGRYSYSSVSSENDVLHIGNNYYVNNETVSVGDRKVFALDVQDIIDYLGTETSREELSMMFYNTTSTSMNGGNSWLRSVNSADTNRPLRVNNIFSITDWSSDSGFQLRPAFVIDLSLLG